MRAPRPRSPAVVPRDAAALVITRRGAGEPAVLLGQRHRGHVFMPNKFVFPGGRVDPGDARAPHLAGLRADVLARLVHGASPARARGLALAAIRETYEEAGLLVGRRVAAPPRTRARAWRGFVAHGVVPALDALEYVARAVTPPGSPRRFDTRFFWVDASHAHAAEGAARGGSGELLDLRWVPLSEASALDLPEATAFVIDEVAKRIASPDPAALPVPFARYARGGVRVESIS
jgi:8-oxo-dGTP pyrophosphatase MutT (NUDIX family)